MAYSKYGLSFKNFTDSYGEWEANGGVEQANKAIDFKNLQNNSFNVRGLPGGTFGQSVIDSTLGVAGNIDDFLGGPTGLGDYANNYVTAQEMAMGEKPKADFSWDYLINGLPRDTGNLIGSGISLAAPIAAATLAAPFVGVGATAAGIGGALAGAGLESMAEGGQKMRDSLANGDSLETAQDKARTVAGENMALLAPTNILGLGALKKVGQGLKTAYNGGKAVSAAGGALANYPRLSQAADFAKGAGWAGLGAMNEGAQEAWQQGIQDSVEPDTDWGILPWNWNDEQAEAFKSTIGPTALMAGAGGSARLAARKLGMSDVPQVDTAPQVNNNLFGAGTAEISTQGADIDEQVAHLKDGYQSVIPQVAGVLVNDFGIEGAQISSGFRTREHNREVGGAENSHHVGDGEHGDALDIVLPDGVSAETAEAIKQRFENSGVFDEVLFHDAGSGYHLHLGGLKTDNIGNSYGSYSGDADVDSAINEMAEKYNLDPALLAAIAEQESGFNQSAQSGAGAMGIMQLMPDTAEGLGVDPSDLRGNLEGGAKYLRQMLDKYDGDVEKALAAYNAGPGSLDSVNGDISQLSGETQKYVPSVMERYNKFKNKSGGGISSSGNILDWDSTNEDFSKLDFFPKDGEQSQGTVNEFLENLAKLEESDDKAIKEKGRQAQDILQQYGDDTEKLTEKAKELGYQQTVNPAEVHGRIPMRRIVSTALNNGQVTFATKKAADIFASSPIGQTMKRQGKTFKVTDNFKMNEQVNAISQQVNAQKQPATKTVQNTVKPDVAVPVPTPLKPEKGTSNNGFAVNLLNALMNIPKAMISKTGTRINPDAVRRYIQNNDLPAMNKVISAMYRNVQEHGGKNKNVFKDVYRESATAVLETLLNTPEALTSTNGARIAPDKVREYMQNGNIPLMTRAINAMSQNLREHGIEPQFSTRANENQLNSQERAPEGAPQMAENNGVTEDSYRARQPEYSNESESKESTGTNSENQTNSPTSQNTEMELADGYSTESGKPLNEANEREFIVKPDGSKDFGEISSDISKAVKEQSGIELSPGKIRLRVGNAKQGLIHAKKHEQQAKTDGYSSIEDMIADVASNFNEIYLRTPRKVGDKPTYSLVKLGDKNTGKKNGTAPVYFDLQSDGNGQYYIVITAIPKGDKSLKRQTKKDHLIYSSPGLDAATTSNGSAVSRSISNNVGAEQNVLPTSDKSSGFSNSTIPQNQNKGNENPNASNEPMRKELIEQAAANEDTWVNSKKSELHLEDDNDTVVKLTPQELKYYQDLVRKGVVAKPELYEESQEDVGEMDDNVEMSKEQKQLYDESSDDRDMPSVEDEAEPTADEPRTKYSREKSPVDEKKPTHHNVECRDVKEQAKRYVQSRLDNDALKTLKPSDDVNTAIEKIIAPIKREVDNQAARYLEAGHEPEYYQARLNMINYYKQLVDEIRRDFNAGDRQSDVYGRVINDTWFRQSAGEGSNLRKSVQKRNAEIETREDENSGVNSSSAKTGKTYENYNPKTQKVLDMMYKHSSRDKSAFSIEPVNPHSAESLKENGNSNTELDRLPKVPIAKLRQSEQRIIKFGKAIGVPVHFVESSDTTNRGVFTHNGEIFINRKAKVPAHSIFVHEFVHWLKASPENAGAYDVLHACLENSSGLFNEARINKYRNKIFDGEKMTDEEIVEEIICDAITHTESAEKLMRAVNNVDGGLATRVAGYLKAMWDKFCKAIGFNPKIFSRKQQLPNALSVEELQKADIAFNKILMNIKGNDGKPVFYRKGTDLVLRDTDVKPVDTYQINPIGYTYAVAYSKENKDKEPIDGNNNQQDNVTIEFAGDKREAQQVFNKHLTQGLKDLTRQTIEKEITDTIKDFEKLADPVELDKAMNDLPAMKRMRQWFQQKDMQSKPAYMDRLAARYEYARRCFLNDSRIRDRFIRPAGRYNQQERISETISSGISRVKRTGQEGSLQQSDGRGTVAPTVGEYKFIKNHFDKLVDNLINGVPKHSKESAFLMPENGKPYTMSYYHNTQPSPKMAGDMFAQSIEPAGEYIAHDTMNGSNQIPGFEYGKISFKSPLVLEHKSTGHGGWKTDLSNMFGGKKGKALSNAIKKAGHDGIITIDSKTGEILETVNLAGNKNNGNKYSRGVDLSPSTDGVAIAARANNNLLANMKGLAKKANAKFNPFHHEELENLRIQKRDKEKDLNLIEYQFVSPTRESKKYKVIHPFVMKGKQAMAKQEKLRFEFNEGMNELDKLLGWREEFHRNDPKFKERKEALNEILLKGDLERKDFTNKELIEAGYDAETIKGYHKMRALLDKAWKLADETKSRIKYQSITSSTQRRAEADFADLKDKNPFAEIISKVHNPDGTVTINYKAPHVRRVAKQTVLPSELENLRKNKDVHIVETTQSLKGTTQVTYYQREAGMGKLKGYIPHVFHGWYVCKVDKDGKAIVDEDGNVAMDNIVTTANSLSEAAKLGRELAKENPNANYRVVPQTFSAPGAQEQAIVMGDFDYAKIVGKVADSMSMSITDAQAMLDNTVKMKNRGRFYGYAKQRKGFKGFEQNVYLATMKYFNQTARYAAMDSFKRDSISMYNRIFGAFDDENVTKRSAMAKWTKQYISDMNGTPTWIEKMINNTLHNFGLGEERAGGRPALWLQQKIMTYPMTILKLGVFNPSSALLNLTQLFNLYGAMGEKVLSPQAYQRLLHKGFADTFRAMNNKDSELGKLLWKDLGLDYQIGMDVASGYSNAEVNNLASLRGFAGRLAGKSMYLFRQSDAFARGVTLLTAYNKALDEGKSKAEAIEYAKEINDKVNFDYSVADEPTIFRAFGPISKVFLQFKKYPVKQLELFQDFYLDGRELGLNRKQSFLRMVKYVAPYMAMSGMMGIPFVSFLGGLVSYAASMLFGDDDWDWEKKIKQLMITEFGEDSPITQWWLYGAGSFIGLNLGSRVGVGEFLGSDSYNSADGLGGLMWNQTTLGSTVNQVSKQLAYRNYAEALKAINPTMGNIALAYKGEVRTTRGRMKYQYQNMAERMWRAIGFTPLNETLAGDLASNEYAEKQEQTKAKQEAVDDFLANPSSENAARLNELGVTPKTLENESARRTMNRHQLNEIAKEKEAAKKKKKPKTYSASDYLKAVQ